MELELNDVIRDFIEKSNSRDVQGLTSLFTSDPVISDEGQTHRGLAEIRGWAERTQIEYGFTLEALNSADVDSETTVNCRVSGNFPGSPVELPFRFKFDAGKIAGIAIG